MKIEVVLILYIINVAVMSFHVQNLDTFKISFLE